MLLFPCITIYKF